MTRESSTITIDRERFPIDVWRLVENGLGHDDGGVTGTLFATGNGYLGLRADWAVIGEPTELQPIRAVDAAIESAHLAANVAVGRRGQLAAVDPQEFAAFHGDAEAARVRAVEGTGCRNS